MRVLEHLEPISGSFLKDLKASADAWGGDWGWTDPDNYDPDLWARSDRSGDRWPDGEASYVGRYDDGLDVAFVSRNGAERFANGRASVSPDSTYEEDPKVSDHWYCFLVWSSESAELNGALGLPITEGYFLVCGAFAQDDEFVPVLLEWHGRRVSPEAVSRMALLALEKIRLLKIVPKVPAPALPVEVLEGIREARTRKLDSRRQNEFVNALLSLDRASFLEALDRLVPWMYGPDAPAAWMEKDPDLCARVFAIKGEVEGLTGKMRLTPWKSGIGNPLHRSLAVGIHPGGRGRSPMALLRDSDGRFSRLSD